MKVKVYHKDGTETGRSVELDDAVFDMEPNDHTIWLDVRRIQSNGRQGTHKAKERSEVAGSRRKLYRQKGTGNARAGDIKSPLRRSGGTIFGPRPRKYGIKVNRKTSQVARRSALSYKAKDNAIRIVEDFSMDQPDTQFLLDLLEALDLGDSKVLLLTAGYDANAYRSGRNIPRFHVVEARQVTTFDVLNAQTVVFQEGAVSSLQDLLGSGVRKKGEAAPAEALGSDADQS